MGLMTCFSLWVSKLFSFALYPQRRSLSEDRWKNKPQSNRRSFKLLLVVFHCQEKQNKQRPPRLRAQKAGLK